jgi:hypothetical protein
MVHLRNQARNTAQPGEAVFADGSGEWKDAADRICAAMVKRAPDAIRKASEALYEQMLYDVQDYLRENVSFNLASELASAKRRAEIAEAQSKRLAALLESHDGALRLLRRAISEGDAKEELLLRVTDMLKEISATGAARS